METCTRLQRDHPCVTSHACVARSRGNMQAFFAIQPEKRRRESDSDPQKYAQPPSFHAAIVSEAQKLISADRCFLFVAGGRGGGKSGQGYPIQDANVAARCLLLVCELRDVRYLCLRPLGVDCIAHMNPHAQRHMFLHVSLTSCFPHPSQHLALSLCATLTGGLAMTSMVISSRACPQVYCMIPHLSTTPSAPTHPTGLTPQPFLFRIGQKGPC
jgi:hypothetical protein